MIRKSKIAFEIKKFSKGVVWAVYGSNDLLLSNVDNAFFVSALGRKRVKMLPDCGHIPQVEQKDRLIEIVRTVLDKFGEK